MQEIQSFQPIELEYSLIDSVIEISCLQMGQDFIHKEDLLPYLNNDTKFCQLIKIGTVIAGFSLMEIADIQVIAAKIKVEKAWFENYFKEYDQMGYRSVTAVHPAFEGRGVASALVKNGLQQLAQKVSVVVCEAWKSSHTAIGPILERCGYVQLKEIPYYWAADSIHLQYKCSHCGAPPCACTAIIYAAFFERNTQEWWERSDLKYSHKKLHMGPIDVFDFVKNKPTPLYIYDTDRIVAKYLYLKQCLAKHTSAFKIYYAMKANRHPALLTHLRIRTDIGIDVCSPNELKLAIQMGFEEKNINFTGSSLSNKDLQFLEKHAQLNINFDSISSLLRFNKTGNNRPIGIRINTATGMAYIPELEYAGSDISKFGIYESEWKKLSEICKSFGFNIVRIHCHNGSGFLTAQLSQLNAIFDKIDRFLVLFPTVKTLNLGGGLGVPQNQGDEVLDLKKWSLLVAEYAKKRGLSLVLEPGDYLVKDAGILISEVTTIEKKAGRLLVGLDCGLNVNNEYAYYKMNLEAVPLRLGPKKTTIETTLYGNINEPIDLFCENKPMNSLQEGERIALLNSGGYGASSSSNHCMRGDFEEYIIHK